MHALSRISAALRPRGLLLNLLPVATRATDRTVEVRVGGAIRRLGYLDDTPRDIQDFQVALAAQQAAIDAQQVVLELETCCPFVQHFETVESWLIRNPARMVAGPSAFRPPAAHALAVDGRERPLRNRYDLPAASCLL